MANFRSSAVIHERRSPRRRSNTVHGTDGRGRDRGALKSRGGRCPSFHALSHRLQLLGFVYSGNFSLAVRSCVRTAEWRLAGTALGFGKRPPPDTSAATVVEQPAFRWDRIRLPEEVEWRERRGGSPARDVQKSAAARRSERSRSVSRAATLYSPLLSSSLRRLHFPPPLRPPLWSESAVTVPFAEPFSTNRAPLPPV